MKYIGAALVCAAGVFMGLGYSRTRLGRMEGLKSICTALGLMKGELRTRLLSMPELCLFMKERLKGPAGDFFRRLEESMELLGEKSFSEIWDGAAEKSFGFLSTAEIRELKILGNTLGRTGLEDETEAIEYCLRYMKSDYDEAKRAYPAEKKLGLGLGTAAAALIVLVLI